MKRSVARGSGQALPGMWMPDDSGTLVRQPKTRCARLDAVTDAAYDAFERDEVVEAMHGFVVADLTGFRSYADEIMACVAKWNSMGCPTQEDCIGGDFTEDRYGLGWAALLWFSQMMPDKAIEWIASASLNGDRMARMFAFKFIGSRMYGSSSERDRIVALGIGSPTLIAFMLIVVILLGLLLVFVINLGKELPKAEWNSPHADRVTGVHGTDF